MTSPVPSNDVPDFTIKRDPIQFRVDDDVFSAPAMISPVTLRKAAEMHGRLAEVSGDEATQAAAAIDLIGDLMRVLMPGPSGRRFVERLRSEGRPADLDDNPPREEPDPPVISLTEQAIPALYYLLERYGLRPTVPSSPSLDGSTDGSTNSPSDGISSTDGVLPIASTTNI